MPPPTIELTTTLASAITPNFFGIIRHTPLLFTDNLFHFARTAALIWRSGIGYGMTKLAFHRVSKLEVEEPHNGQAISIRLGEV